MVPYIHLGALSTTLRVFLGPTMYVGVKKNLGTNQRKLLRGCHLPLIKQKGGKVFMAKLLFFQPA